MIMISVSYTDIMTFRSELGREVFDLNESLLEGKFVLENANVGGNVIKHLSYTFF